MVSSLNESDLMQEAQTSTRRPSPAAFGRAPAASMLEDPRHVAAGGNIGLLLLS